MSRGRNSANDPRRTVEYGDMFPLLGGPLYAPPADIDRARFYDAGYRAGLLSHHSQDFEVPWQQAAYKRGYIHGHFDGLESPCKGCS